MIPRLKPPAPLPEDLLDEGVIVTILSRHFPTASRDALRDAAGDLLLLQMLMRDESVNWEDAMSERPDGAGVVDVLHPQYRTGS
jgi:hypothetical protein